jgi:tetraacyldisaccharide 4'-kinase
MAAVGDDCREVTPDSTPGTGGDEPLLVRRSTAAPVFVAPPRMEAARALRQTYPDTT